MLELVVVQPEGALLKFSFKSVVAVFGKEFEVALDVRLTELPEQIVEALAVAVTLDGTVRFAPGRSANNIDALFALLPLPNEEVPLPVGPAVVLSAKAAPTVKS